MMRIVKKLTVASILALLVCSAVHIPVARAAPTCGSGTLEEKGNPYNPADFFIDAPAGAMYACVRVASVNDITGEAVNYYVDSYLDASGNVIAGASAVTGAGGTVQCTGSNCTTSAPNTPTTVTPSTQTSSQAPKFVPLANYSGSQRFSQLYGDRANLSTFFNNAFNLVISLAAMAAVLRLVYAGYLYMGSDVWGNISKAKGIIGSVVIGMVLLLSIWLILNQINPCLLNLNILQTNGSGNPQCQSAAQSLQQGIAPL
jgi:hypothetical protein